MKTQKNIQNTQAGLILSNSQLSAVRGGDNTPPPPPPSESVPSPHFPRPK